jgi:hypothetical protein
MVRVDRDEMTFQLSKNSYNNIFYNLLSKVRSLFQARLI